MTTNECEYEIESGKTSDGNWEIGTRDEKQDRWKYE
jgi:hypothetical protein